MVALLPLLAFAAAGCGSSPKTEAPAAHGKSLDAAVQEAAEAIEAKLDQGAKVALLNFSSTSEQFSQYVLDELSANLVNSGKLVIVDRQEIDLIRGETDFQLSGEVSDESAQEVGKMLGAQSIVSGSLANIGNTYRINIKVLNVQSAAINVQYRSDIAADSKVQALLASGGGAGTATAAASGGQAGGTTAQAAKAPPAPAGPKNGTYTFFPRLRATRGGIPVDAYIDRVEVSGNFMVFYMTNVARGWGSRPFYGNGWYIVYHDFLTDLDNPSKNYTAKTYSDIPGGGMALSFENVRATRFSLECTYDTPVVFGEIILGEPD
jgi:TolB-like protein